MLFELIPTWYFLLSLLCVTGFCGYAAIKCIERNMQYASDAMDIFARELVDQYDRNDRDRLDEFENFKVRVSYAQRGLQLLEQKVDELSAELSLQILEQKVEGLCQVKHPPKKISKPLPKEKAPSQH